MSILDTKAQFGAVSRINHWLSTLIILGLLAIGLYFSEMPRGDEKTYLVKLHIAVASLAWLFLMFRILWRGLSRQTEELPQPAALQLLTRTVKGVLLLALLVMLISGPLMVWTAGLPIAAFDLFSIPSPTGKIEWLHEGFEETHEETAWVIIVALSLHVLGTLKHLLFDRATFMGRMLGNPSPAQAGTLRPKAAKATT
jgi:cytochrome b561